jgi:hypothetical protein
MKHKYLIIAILLATCFCSIIKAESVDKDVSKLLSRMERYIYGSEQDASISDRLKQIEEDMFGRTTGQTNENKAKYLHDFIFVGSVQNPSLDMKLSYLEWKLFNETNEGTLEERLAKIDKYITGIPSNEAMAFRLEQQVHLIIENGLIIMHTVTIPAGTKLKVKTKKKLSSKTAKKGDIVPMVIVDDVFVNDSILVMTKGGIVSPTVKSVRKSGSFGRTGYINLDLSSIESMDSTNIKVSIDSAGEKYDKKRIGMAAGASTIGYLVLGPIGLAGGVFVKGGEIEIPVGTEFEVITREDCKVTGVSVPKKN